MMILLAVKLGIRAVVFALVFWLATRKNKNIVITPRYALPLVAVVFALLNIGLYWLATPLLNLVTLGAAFFVMPFIVNGLLLYMTARILRPLKINGILTMLWLAGVLTLAHFALYIVVDVLIW